MRLSEEELLEASRKSFQEAMETLVKDMNNPPEDGYDWEPGEAS